MLKLIVMMIITFSQITGYFLPKVAKEYDIIDESNSSSHRISHIPFGSIPSIISSSLLSNNRISIHHCEESTQADKEGESISQKKKKAHLLIT